MSPVKVRARELGLPVHQPASFKDPGARTELEALELDALVVVAYGLILPREALAAPRLGCFNIHASLLPRWRGAAPIQRAILAGDRTTGISIMRMEEKLDTGPVLTRRAIAIDPLDTAGTLHDRLAALGAELIRLAIDEVAAGAAVETAQPEDGVTYAEKITKAEALIGWHEDAGRVLDKVRAFNPAPVAETRWDGHQLRIWEAAPGGAAPHHAAPGTVLSASPRGIEVACGRGALSILRLQLAGRKPVAAAEFVRAHALAGAHFSGT
jgi:methionyl-tRNA formyltransferase